MARSYGSAATLLVLKEATYGVKPSGNWEKFAFTSSDLSAEQKDQIQNILQITRNRALYFGRKIVAEVVDVGDYDTVIGRNFLSESAFGVGKNPHEANVLQSMLGNCQILPLARLTRSFTRR